MNLPAEHLIDNPQDGIAFIEGKYMPLSQASVPITDRGFVRSDATYDVAHVWKGRFFRLDDHIERFFTSMQGLRMTLPYSHKEIADILIECVSRSGLRDAYVQMTCTRGLPPVGSRDPRLCTQRFYAFASPFVWISTQEQQKKGVPMIVSAVHRIAPEAVDPRIKNFHWLDLTMGIFEAYDRDAFVAVLRDGAGNITEGAGFNVFVVKDGALCTPDAGVFEGMTRRTVLDLCTQLQLRCEVRPVSIAEIQGADEVFMTSTAGGIMPVTTLDAKPVGSGLPGKITSRLQELYWRRQEEGWLGTPVPYKDAVNPA